jgi:hypothetical protein
MDFIERIFHLSPDQGSGSYEAWLVTLVGFLVLVAVLVSKRRRRRGRQNQDGNE